MLQSDKQLNLLRAKSEQLLLPEEVRRIRKKLQLTQEKAGLLLGGGPNAFNKYENGLVLPSQAVSSLLRILESNPDTLAVLYALESEADRNVRQKQSVVEVSSSAAAG
jgi:HTH-type transcriptional regulator/antitoxin MqsA